jgi:hypothetical protein
MICFTHGKHVLEFAEDIFIADLDFLGYLGKDAHFTVVDDDGRGLYQRTSS